MVDKFFTYFSYVLNKDIVDVNARHVGRVRDLSMNLNNDIYPRARGIIACRGLLRRRFVEIPMSEVSRITDKVHLNCPLSALHFQDSNVSCEFALRRDVLDQQVVDVENRKVVRVNDVHLLRVDNQLHIAHVDVGLRALVRRLDWEPVVDAMVGLIKPKAEYLKAEELVSWKNSQVLTLGNIKNVLKLDVARAKIAKIPPVELAEIMGDLDVFEQASLLRTLPFDVQLKVFTDMAQDDRLGLVAQLNDKEAAQLVANIPSDEAADFLLALPKPRMHRLMRHLETQTSKKLRKLLGFRRKSAGGLMEMEFLSLRNDATVADAMAKIRASVDFPGSLTTLYIVDEKDKYLGTTTIRRFINEDPARPIIETCHPQKLFVRTDDGMEEIALILEQYKYSAIPVLDEQGILVGSITVDDVMEEMIALAWGKYKDQL
ncbi:MAG: magnesium transporter [Candidatus Omnitrophica bacterium]|nr:magnesium transporter [Candidatus Omnitrophota bacterium]